VRVGCARGAALAVLLLVSAAAGAAGAGQDGELLDHNLARRWGLGWDAYQSTPTLARRLGQGWEVALAGGPQDYRADRDERGWDVDSPADAPAYVASFDDRTEQGWIALWADRRVWRHGRCELAVTAGAQYRWSNEQARSRTRGTRDGGILDYRNRRSASEIDTWWVRLGIRPRVALAERVTAEFRAGYYYLAETESRRESVWWDGVPGIERSETSYTRHQANTFGPYDFWNITIMFWF